jgi:transcriptional regulator with PAS, ATPase and Fis domain
MSGDYRASSVSLLIRDRSGWRRFALGRRLEISAHAGADLRLPDAPAGAWLRLRREGDDVVITGENAHGQRLGLLSGRARVLRPMEVVRMGPVALMWFAEEPELSSRPGTSRAPLLRCGDGLSGCAEVWSAWGDLLLAAGSEWPLLVLGGSGTGKELAARVAHAASRRAEGPMVAINAGALPPGTLHSELFGARRGAYTGSVADREGAFGRADGGTLLIDEIGELDAVAQAALLRVLETGEITPVGGETRKVDVRIITATHRELDDLVGAGRFRLDLLHRLAVVTTTLPDLQDRNDDAVQLLEYQLGRGLDQAGRDVVRAHHWPGNLRELRNVARRIAISIADGEPTAADLRAAIGARRPTVASEAEARRAAPRSLLQRRSLVASAIARQPSTAEACRDTGLPRATFYRLLRELRAA